MIVNMSQESKFYVVEVVQPRHVVIDSKADNVLQQLFWQKFEQVVFVAVTPCKCHQNSVGIVLNLAVFDNVEKVIERDGLSGDESLEIDSYSVCGNVS